MNELGPVHPIERPTAILVTHAALGAELLRTVEAILGVQKDVYFLSNDGYSSEGLSRAIEERAKAVPGENAIVLFTDLAAGSCGIASRRASCGGRVVRTVTGINLPMLLEFFHYRDTLPLHELLTRLETKGKAGITVT